MSRQFSHAKDLRKGRYSEENRAYFITSCCQDRKKLFFWIELALIVLEEVRLQESMGDCTSLAVVVMPDHMHWLMQLGAERSLQQIMNSLKGRSARRINLERSARQKVWQAGFHDRAIRRGEDLEFAASYLIQNPVRAGLVERHGQYPFWESVYHDKSHRA